jgi:hypothetical protein
MAGFWGESHFRAMAGKGEMRCRDFIGVQKMPTEKESKNRLPGNIAG